jgi:hypothetical protein
MDTFLSSAPSRRSSLEAPASHGDIMWLKAIVNEITASAAAPRGNST